MEKKVLFTASTYSHIVNFHLPYLAAFRENGWIVHVACGGREMPIDCADAVMHAPFQKKMSSPENFKVAGKLRTLIKSERYDLICTHTSLAAFFTRLAVKGLRNRPRVINMAHGYLFDDRTAPLKRSILLAAERLTAPETDLLLTMNRFDYETAIKHHLGRQVQNVPGIGVDFSAMHPISAEERNRLRRELGISQDKFVLIYAAEFSKRKNQSVLIHALKKLPNQVILVLAGDGALLDECKALAGVLDLRDRVLFPGYIRDIPLWYGASDAVVSSSRSEGLPFNIMEAMHLGLPVVASDVKGHEDLICHGETGLLYPYGDSDACAAQILTLMESESLSDRIAHNAKEFVAQFDLNEVFPVIMNLYMAAEDEILTTSGKVDAQWQEKEALSHHSKD